VRFIILSILLSLLGWAHSTVDLSTEEEEANFHYGVYGIAEYRTKDLYPHGIEGSVGYENHGAAKKIQFTHLGAYLYGKTEADFLYGLELNHHKGAENTLNQTIERAYLGYETDTFGIKAGRGYNNLSFLNEKAWGYGFGSMPLAIDSFVDGTYIGDGLFVEYAHGPFKAYADVTKDQYNKVLRSTLKAEYDLDTLRVIAYFQSRDTTLTRVDYAQTQHSHGGTDDCTNLSPDERCFQRESRVFGLGFDTLLADIKVQGEYIYLDTEGSIENSEYQIRSDNAIHTLYLQMLGDYHHFIWGARSEWFMLDNSYTGPGATEIAGPLVSEDANEIQDLQTLLIGYQFDEGNRFLVEAKHSQNGWAAQFNYFFLFGH